MPTSSRTGESDRNLRGAAPTARFVMSCVCLTPFWGGRGVYGGKPAHTPVRGKRKRHGRVDGHAVNRCAIIPHSQHRRLPGRVGQGAVSVLSTCVARLKD